jgi:hypothetical protein
LDVGEENAGSNRVNTGRANAGMFMPKMLPGVMWPVEVTEMFMALLL